MRIFAWQAVLSAVVFGAALTVGAHPAAAAVSGPHAAGVMVASGSIFSKIAGAVLGAFSWTTGVAAKFILVTLAAFIRMLIPASWAHVPVAVFDWIVAIPNYAGSVTSPSGQTSYGFAGVNAIRELFQWIGIALIPVTLTWSTTRAMLGIEGHAAAPLVRLLGMAGVLVFYPWLWAQAAALVDQVTHLILSFALVTAGIRQLMAYATEGVALGGWQLIDLALIGAIASELLALVFVKVVVVLVGAILYAVGPLMIGVVAAEHGAGIARAWVGAVVTLLMVPVAWAAIFAVGAVLIGDASTAGILVGGSSTIEQILGGVIVAVAGVATLWLCLRASREASTLVRGQLATITPAVARMRSTSSSRPATTQAMSGRSLQAAQSVRGFRTRVASSAGAASAAAGPRGEQAVGVAGHTANLGRRGLLRGGATLTGAAIRTGARSARAHTVDRRGLTGSSSGTSGGPERPAARATRTRRARVTASRMLAGGRTGWHEGGRRSTAQRSTARHTPARVPRSAARPTGERLSGPPAGRSSAPRPAPAPRPGSAERSSQPRPGARTSQTSATQGGEATPSRPGVTTQSRRSPASAAPSPSKPAGRASGRTDRAGSRPASPAPDRASRVPSGRNATTIASRGEPDRSATSRPAGDSSPRSGRRDAGEVER
jgi:hypothetical protein